MAKSEYLQREEAAKKQLGAKGVKKRVKQLPTAARAFTREMTGIDVSRKGVSVDPIGLAMAVSPFKLLKASRALRAAGKVGKAAAVEARIAAKAGGKKYGGLDQGLPINTSIDVGSNARRASESVFPRLPSRGGDAPRLLRGQRDLRTFDRYADPINEGAGRFKSQNLLDTMIQGSTTRSGMKSVSEAQSLARRAAARKAGKRNR